jgi:serine phosphatase RsbU (regulator of sigma subunit)
LIDFDGFVADTHYEAAIDESLIGGDFGDVFRIDESRVALIIGDCTGKGLDAARFVGECQFATRAFIRETPDEPAQVLSRVNRMLLDDQRFDGRPITALACMTIAVIDTLTGAVRIAVGGSEPPIIYRNQEKIAEEVQVRSPMLGIQDDMTFAVLDLQLQDGDVLALTTDGITEARDQETRALFGYPRLLQSVQEIGSSQPAVAGFAERIATAAKCFASSHLTDDACVIVGKWHRPAGD